MDRELLQQLYSKYSKELYLYIYSMCKKYSVAEDLLQETFLKALLSLDNNHQNFKAWLYLVGKNLTLNYLKKDKKNNYLEEIEEISDTNSIIEKVIFKDRDKKLYEAILTLPKISQQVIILQYFSKLSQTEISSVLGLSAGNVRTIAHRAKKQIKQYLEVQGYEF